MGILWEALTSGLRKDSYLVFKLRGGGICIIISSIISYFLVWYLFLIMRHDLGYALGQVVKDIRKGDRPGA